MINEKNDLYQIIFSFIGSTILHFEAFVCKTKTCYYRKKLKLPDSSFVSGDNNLSNTSNITLGYNTYINGGGHIIASPNARISIGSNCLISYNVHFRTDMHNYLSKEVLIKNQGHREASIIIEDDVWIGFGVQIMAGVTVHKGAVIAAGAIVTKDVPEYSVVGGIPAIRIKERE